MTTKSWLCSTALTAWAKAANSCASISSSRIPLTGLEECNGDVHRRGRFTGAAFFVPKDDNMRRERTAELRLHQHETQPLRYAYFQDLQRERSRYSICGNKLIVNELMRRRNASGCAYAATSP